MEKRGDAGTPHKRGGAVTPCAFVEALPPLSGAAELHRSGANLPRKFTLRFYGVTHYTLRCKECAIRSLWTPLKAAAEQKQSTSIASASLHPYGSFRHKHTRSLSLTCRIEVDNILTVGSNVSLRNGRVYPLLPPPRPPFSRWRLCICGGSYHISDDTATVFFGW